MSCGAFCLDCELMTLDGWVALVSLSQLALGFGYHRHIDRGFPSVHLDSRLSGDDKEPVRKEQSHGCLGSHARSPLSD
jgi:hypothetical protein